MTNNSLLEAELSFIDDDFLVDFRALLANHPKRKRLPKFPKGGDITWKQVRNVALKADIYYSHTLTQGLDGEEVEQREVDSFTKLSEVDKAFVEAMVTQRETQGLTRNEIAEKMGVSAADVNKVETGEPTFSLIQKYAAALGLAYSHALVEQSNLLEENREQVEETIAALTAAGREKDVYKLTRTLLRGYHTKGSAKTQEDLEELLESYSV